MMEERAALEAHIERNSVADQVYALLKSDILNGQISLGERVVESKVASRLRISRAPVREAVQRLIQEGLLETRTHHGPSVIQLTRDDIKQLYEVRIAIESRAIIALCKAQNADHLQQLELQITKMRQASHSGDAKALVENELEFHTMLCRFAGNAYLLRISESLQDQVRLALTLDNANYSEMRNVAEEHTPLVQAIRSGDSTAAIQQLEIHILASLDAMG